MIAGIEDGTIDTVIVKDISRIGRDYLQVGYGGHVQREGRSLYRHLQRRG